MTDRPDLDALEAAHAKATAGEWQADAFYIMVGKRPLAKMPLDCFDYKLNAAAIAALHNAFPAHLAYTRALEARVDELEACAQNCAGQFDSYVDAHNAKGPDGHVKALKNAVWRDYAMSVLDGNAKPTPESAKIVALEAEVARMREALPLILAIATWEKVHGTVAAIMPHEYAEFCKAISYAAISGSARAALNAKDAA